MALGTLKVQCTQSTTDDTFIIFCQYSTCVRLPLTFYLSSIDLFPIYVFLWYFWYTCLDEMFFSTHAVWFSIFVFVMLNVVLCALKAHQWNLNNFSHASTYTSAKEFMFSVPFVCLSAGFRKKLPAQFSWNFVEECSMGQILFLALERAADKMSHHKVYLGRVLVGVLGHDLHQQMEL